MICRNLLMNIVEGVNIVILTFCFTWGLMDIVFRIKMYGGVCP